MDRNVASMFKSLAVKRRHLVPIFAEKKCSTIQMCHFKLLQLKQVSHKAWLSQESHSAVCRKPVIWWWAAVTQSLINGEICLTAANFLWVTVCFSVTDFASTAATWREKVKLFRLQFSSIIWVISSCTKDYIQYLFSFKEKPVNLMLIILWCFFKHMTNISLHGTSCWAKTFDLFTHLFESYFRLCGNK